MRCHIHVLILPVLLHLRLRRELTAAGILVDDLMVDGVKVDFGSCCKGSRIDRVGGFSAFLILEVSVKKAFGVVNIVL